MNTPVIESIYRRELARELTFLRKSFGMNQLEFSNLVGVHKTTIGRYERGERTPCAYHLYKICLATNTKGNNLIFPLFLGDET